MKLTRKQEDTIYHHAYRAALAERHGDNLAYHKHGERLLSLIQKLSEPDKKRAMRIIERGIREAMKQ